MKAKNPNKKEGVKANNSPTSRGNGRRQTHPPGRGRGGGGRIGGGGRGEGQRGQGGRLNGNGGGQGDKVPQVGGNESVTNLITPKPLMRSWTAVVSSGAKQLTFTPDPKETGKNEGDVGNDTDDGDLAGPVWQVPSPKLTGYRVEQQPNKKEKGSSMENNRYEVLSDEEDEDEKVEKATVVDTVGGKKERNEKDQQVYRQKGRKIELSTQTENSKKNKKKKTTMKKKDITWDEGVTRQLNQQQVEGKSGKRTEKQTITTNLDLNGKKIVEISDQIRRYRVFQLARNLQEEGQVGMECFESLNTLYARTGALVSLATNSILERTDEIHQEAGDVSKMVFEYLSPLSDKCLYEIINDRVGYEVTKRHVENIQQQQKKNTIGQTTDLFCEDTLRELMGKERIDGTEVHSIIGQWMKRYYPRKYGAMETFMKQRRWSGEEVRQVMTSEADHIWKEARLSVSISALQYDREEQLRESVYQIEAQVKTLLESPLHAEGGVYQVRLMKMSSSKLLGHKAAVGLAQGVSQFSSGAVLVFSPGDTVEQVLTRGTYMEEGKQGRPSPIQSAQEIQMPPEQQWDLVLKSGDQNALKMIVAYVIRALPVLSRSTRIPTLMYDIQEPTQEEQRECNQLYQRYGMTLEELPTKESLRRLVLDPSKIQEVLRTFECSEVRKQRIHSHFITSTTPELFKMMSWTLNEIGQLGISLTGHLPQYKYGRGSAATKSNVLTRYTMRIENNRNTQQVESVAWDAMKALRHALEAAGHRCVFPAFPKGELPEKNDVDTMQRTCNPEMDMRGKWKSVDIGVLMSYKRPHRLLDRNHIGLGEPQKWFRWLFNSGVRVTWKDMHLTMVQSAMIVYTTELALSNRDELVIEIDQMWRGNDGFVPPAFQIDMDQVSWNGQRTNSIVIFTTSSHRPAIARLIENMERNEDQMTLGTHPSLYGTRIVPIMSSEGELVNLSSAIEKQKKYLTGTTRVSIIGIDAKVNFDALIPSVTGMWKSEENVANELSVRKLMLLGSVRTKEGEDIPSPVLRCGRTSDNRWTMEGQEPFEQELHEFATRMVKRHLPDYLHDVIRTDSLTLHSKYGPSERANSQDDPSSNGAQEDWPQMILPQALPVQEPPSGIPPSFKDYTDGTSSAQSKGQQVETAESELEERSTQEGNLQLEHHDETGSNQAQYQRLEQSVTILAEEVKKVGEKSEENKQETNRILQRIEESQNKSNAMAEATKQNRVASEGGRLDEKSMQLMFQRLEKTVANLAAEVRQMGKSVDENQRRTIDILQTIDNRQLQKHHEEDDTTGTQTLEGVRQVTDMMKKAIADFQQQVSTVIQGQEKMAANIVKALEVDITEIDNRREERDEAQAQNTWRYMESLERSFITHMDQSLATSSDKLMRKMDQKITNRNRKLEQSIALFNNSLFESVINEFEGPAFDGRYENHASQEHEEEQNRQTTSAQNDETYDKKLGVSEMCEELDNALQNVIGTDDTVRSKRGRDPALIQSGRVQTPTNSCERKDNDLGLSTDPSPQENKLAKELEIAERMQAYTNNQDSPQRNEESTRMEFSVRASKAEQERTDQDDQDQDDKSVPPWMEFSVIARKAKQEPVDQDDQDQDDETATVVQSETSEVGEVSHEVCSKCGLKFTHFHDKTKCLGCGKRFHVRCIAASSRARCDICVEAQPSSDEGESSEESDTESSSRSDSDESYREENKMMITAPRRSKRGQTNRGGEPERRLDSSLQEGSEEKRIAAKPPPKSLSNATTTEHDLCTESLKSEEQDEQDD